MTLNLGSATTATIYVRNTSQSGLQFSTDNATWVSKPITWEPLKGSAALRATFSLQTGVTAITADSPNITQNGNVFTVQTTAGDDNFKVTKAGGHTEDPQIVVTPQ
jgi:hypothetical protein